MGGFFGLFGNDDEKTTNKEVVARDMDTSLEPLDRDNHIQSTENGTLHLHQEELDISKNRTNAGEVILSKEIVEERKIVDVPVTHEEVVIERRAINNEISNSSIGEEETIRIPVSEEHVDVSKHTVTTGEVSAYKRAVEQTQHIEEMLRKEEARVNTTGTVNVVSSENDDGISNGSESIIDTDISDITAPRSRTTNDIQAPIDTNASVAEVSDNNYNGDLTPS